MVGGSLNDRIELIGDSGETVQLDLARDVVALRGSLGLSFPIDQHLIIRPFVTLAVSDMQSESIVDEQFVANNELGRNRFNSNTQVLSTVGSAEALYLRWFGEHQLEASAQYNLIHNNAFSEDNPVLTTEAWDHTIQFKSRFSGPTKLVTAARPWRWHAYANFTSFLSHNEVSLGYNECFEFGSGLDWKINIKPLDWFGWQYLGIRIGLIIGEGVNGYNVGLTAR